MNRRRFLATLAGGAATAAVGVPSLPAAAAVPVGIAVGKFCRGPR